MIKTLTALTQTFESSSTLTKQFSSFSRLFKREFKQLLFVFGASKIEISRGHFGLSGFFQIAEQIWYFSLGDVRWSKGSMLVRTAESFTDYTGGSNNHVAMDEGFIYNLKRMVVK